MQVKASVHELRDICHPSKEHRKDIYRKISLYCIKPLLNMGFHANHITLLRLCCLVFFIVFFFQSNDVYVLFSALFLQLIIFFDTLDGAIARYRKESSLEGELYDVLLDYSLSVLVIPLIVGIKSMQITGNNYFLVIGIFTSLFLFVTAVSRATYRERSFTFEKKRKESALFRFINSDSIRFTSLLFLGVVVLKIIPLLSYVLFLIGLFKMGVQLYLLYSYTGYVQKSKEFKTYLILVIEVFRLVYAKISKKNYVPYYLVNLKNSKLGREFLQNT